MNKQSVIKSNLGGFVLTGLSVLFSTALIAGPVDDSGPKKDSTQNKYINWHNCDYGSSQMVGIETEKAYNEVLKNKKSKTVIVAIIDSGVDIEHEDIQGKIWINEDEIVGNNIDDDNNGYIDDINGWNFIGAKDGENIGFETMELTRLYKEYVDAVKQGKANKLKASSVDYKKVKKLYEQKAADTKQQLDGINQFIDEFKANQLIVAKLLKKEDYTLADFESVDTQDPKEQQALSMIKRSVKNNFAISDLEGYKSHLDEQMNYSLNMDFNPRKMIGDNPYNNQDIYYGNNNVKGPYCFHGTHVTGIVAANRHNNMGLDGIADNVKIMVLRAVPKGDERDKDIANAIRYAVDNGAQVINMSFGKDFSPQKAFVDQAIKYADEKGVLLIHAAGNDGLNIDKNRHFPARYLESDKQMAKNWITVGASSMSKDLKMVGNFTNYGKKDVDVFAPGVDIYSMAPESEYKLASGTSMSAPVVTGVAAVLFSYYPQLTAAQVKDIILQSSDKYEKMKVIKPGSGKKKKTKKFKKLSSTAGIVNLYNAVKMAERM
ncbi:MAG: S8 family peptidase [Bacteroidales bacterium]|nr:S8 family peptidase [Bacteroidales bacterium]